MSAAELDKILRHTLEDFRLSRGEKRMLAKVIEEVGADEHKLAAIRSRVFDIAREELDGAQDRAVLDWLEDANKLLAPRPPEAPPLAAAFFSPGDDCPRAINNQIASAERQIDICVFTITDDRITDAILTAHRRGVAIRIVTDNDKSNDTGSDIDRLKNNGIAVRFDRSEYHMHHKFALFDRRTLLTGSYNWTRGAANNNEENFLITGDERLVREFASQFERMWEGMV